MEVAGVALAIFPLVIQGISNLVQATSTVKRFKHYHRELKRDARTIENEWTGFQLSIENLVSCIGHSYEDSQALLKTPGGSAWKEPKVRKSLQSYLDTSYLAFVQTIEDLVEDLELLCEKLNIDSDTKQVQSVGFFEDSINRFKHTFGQSVYKEIFDRIRNANDFLRRTAFQSQASQSWRLQGKSRMKGAGIARLRKQARSLHQSLAKHERWSCPCRDRHLLGLNLGELESRMVLSRADVVSFEVGITAMKVNSMSCSPLLLEEWKMVKVECRDQKDDADDDGIQQLDPGVAIPAKVQFQLQPHHKTQQPDSSPQKIISDLCSVLERSWPQPDSGNGYLGHLKIAESLGPMHGLFRKPPPWPEGSSLELMSDLLTKLSHTTQIPRGAAIFPRRSRLVVAAQLALSVIVLDGSWLREGWTSNDFLVVRGALRTTTAAGTIHEEDALLLPCKVRGEDDSLTPSFRHSSEIRCAALFALGITLVELSLGANLEDLKEVCDENPDRVVSRRKTAFRLLPRVEEQEGDQYANVVEKCLDCPFDVARRDLSFDNAKFRDLVYDSIVIPLKEIAAVFNKR